LRQLPQYRAMRESGMPEEQVLKELRKPVETRIFTWEGIKKTEMSFYDSVKHHIQFLQAGVLAMEPGSGAIRAWVGGIDYRFFQYDHVRPETRRQVGSTIKPLLYTASRQGKQNTQMLMTRGRLRTRTRKPMTKSTRWKGGFQDR
jgi:penicillin-binding protein 1A